MGNSIRNKQSASGRGLQAVALFLLLLILAAGTVRVFYAQEKTGETAQTEAQIGEFPESEVQPAGIPETEAQPAESSETEAEGTTADKPVFEPGASCSVYIYMCGSNLESKYGFAAHNIQELLEADIPDHTNVVMQTGGSSKWWGGFDIADDRLSRYVIRDKNLELEETLENASMGNPETFSSFLEWGLENYPADRTVLVIWDHGGSSSDEVCYDENFHFDGLSLEELQGAFDAVQLPSKFDLMVFDTCYMGSLGTASLASKYAYYMTASQKIVPGGGIDYKTLVESFEGNDDETFGRIICDSFLEKCKSENHDKEVQLSLYDLSRTSALVSALDLGSAYIRLERNLNGNSFKIFNAALNAHVADSAKDINVVDLLTFMEGVFGLKTDRKLSVIRAMKDALIRYQVKGELTDCTGVSIYYPLTYSEQDMEIHDEAFPARNYIGLLRDIYSELPEETIVYEDTGSIAEDGSFEITLSKESGDYLRGIVCRIWQESSILPGSYALLCEGEVDTYNTESDRENAKLTVNSTFNGNAAALDGHVFMLTVVPRRKTATYSAPICVNGEDTYYTFVRSKETEVHTLVSVTLGNGTDINGLPTRDLRQLQPGDRVRVYAAADEKGEELYPQEEFTIGEDGGKLSMVPLPAGRYRYQFVAKDIVGKEYVSKYAIFEISEDGGERSAQMVEVLEDEPW